MRKIRKKKCTVCGESFLPQYTSLQKCCSAKCAIEYSKTKTANHKAGLNEMRNEKESIQKLSAAIEYTTNLVHKYIRLRDKGKPCISCNRSWDSSFQAGHRFNVKQHNGIRFDLDNIHGQCPKCNMYEEGNYNSYHLSIPERIGIYRYGKLEKRAKIAHNVPHTFTRHELGSINQEMKKLIRELNAK